MLSVLADLKVELGYYAHMLTWTQKDGIIKATPKRKLSDLSHKIILKTFRRAGGNYVSKDGSHYFELVLTPRQLSPWHKIAVAFHDLDGQLFKERTTI